MVTEGGQALQSPRRKGRIERKWKGNFKVGNRYGGVRETMKNAPITMKSENFCAKRTKVTVF